MGLVRASKSAGAPLPGKNYGSQKKLEEYLKQNPQKMKRGLRMLILFCTPLSQNNQNLEKQHMHLIHVVNCSRNSKMALKF